MKLMKHIMIALVLCAIPAVAFGQKVICDDCTHDVSVFMGEGGLIATAAEEAEMVTWVAQCDGVTRSGKLTPNDDGVVSMLFNMDNMLACNADDGRLQLGPVMDGGWFWITSSMSSAVGNLVGMDVQDNETTMITDAGDGVTTTEGRGAVLLTELSSGRTGLLPTILPVPTEAPMPATVCGPIKGTSPLAQRGTQCMLGDGGTMISLRGPIGHGKLGPISNEVTRNQIGDLVIYGQLWLNESGSVALDTTKPGSVGKGWSSIPGNPLEVETWAGTLVNATPGATLAGAGVVIDASSGAITISPSLAYCSTANNLNITATVKLTAVDNATRNSVFPKVARKGGVAAATEIDIMCPPAVANMGTELVPENPFPTTE